MPATTATTAGSTPANQISAQIRAGIVSLTAASRFVPFSQPMPNANYVVLFEPTLPMPTVSGRTSAGFTVGGHTPATVGWLAVSYI